MPEDEATITPYGDRPPLVAARSGLLDQDGNPIDAPRQTAAPCRRRRSRLRPFCPPTAPTSWSASPRRRPGGRAGGPRLRPPAAPARNTAPPSPPSPFPPLPPPSSPLPSSLPLLPPSPPPPLPPPPSFPPSLSPFPILSTPPPPPHRPVPRRPASTEGGPDRVSNAERRVRLPPPPSSLYRRAVPAHPRALEPVPPRPPARPPARPRPSRPPDRLASSRPVCCERRRRHVRGAGGQHRGDDATREPVPAAARAARSGRPPSAPAGAAPSAPRAPRARARPTGCRAASAGSTAGEAAGEVDRGDVLVHGVGLDVLVEEVQSRAGRRSRAAAGRVA